jgi:hypothetical protein
MPIGAGEQAMPAQIDRNGVLILVRSALIALDEANKARNYTVLRDLGAPAFQANSAARLGEIFAGLPYDGLDLSGVEVPEPQLTLLPQINDEAMMKMTGFFPSAPAQINFRPVAVLRNPAQPEPVQPAKKTPAKKQLAGAPATTRRIWLN